MNITSRTWAAAAAASTNCRRMWTVASFTCPQEGTITSLRSNEVQTVLLPDLRDRLLLLRSDPYR